MASPLLRLAEEAEILARGLASVPIPVVAVLINHDFEAGKAPERYWKFFQFPA
jgi:hypothetical protein